MKNEQMGESKRDYETLVKAVQSLLNEMEHSMELFRTANLDFINTVFEEAVEEELTEGGVFSYYHGDFAYMLHLMKKNINRLKFSQTAIELKNSINHLDSRLN